MEIFKSDKVDRVVFHFNKASNQDPTIPMWVVKHKGKTYNVNHVNSSVGFSTKETPENEHTKGSIQFRGILTIVETDGQVIAEIN